MAPDATYALRVGSVVAALALFVLLVAPGSRADDTMPQAALMALREAGNEQGNEAPTTQPAPITVAPTVAPTTAPATATAAPASVPTTAPKPTAPPPLRVPSVFDLVGITINRGTTWIAIATVTVVDQGGAPVADFEVEGTWSVGATPASCRTDSAGKCSMYQSPLPSDVQQTTITITAPQTAVRAIPRPN
jgi:hypothetical protein